MSVKHAKVWKYFIFLTKQESVRIKEDYKMHTCKLLNIEVLLKDKCVKMSCACLLWISCNIKNFVFGPTQ